MTTGRSHLDFIFARLERESPIRCNEIMVTQFTSWKRLSA